MKVNHVKKIKTTESYKKSPINFLKMTRYIFMYRVVSESERKNSLNLTTPWNIYAVFFS